MSEVGVGGGGGRQHILQHIVSLFSFFEMLYFNTPLSTGVLSLLKITFKQFLVM